MAVQYYVGSRLLLYAIQGSAPVAMLDIDLPENVASLLSPAIGMNVIAFGAASVPIMRPGLVNVH